MIVYRLRKGSDEDQCYCSAESCTNSNRGPLNPAGWLLMVMLTGARSSPSNLATVESMAAFCPEHACMVEAFLKTLIGNLEG